MERQAMINAGFVDFLLTGYIGPALLLFIPLMIAACLISKHQEQTASAEQKAAAERELPLGSAGR